MGVSGNAVLAWIIGLGWILANLSVLAYGVIVISRYLLAQSFDRFLPSRISNVSTRFGSPVIALGISLILTVALIGLAAFNYGGGLLGGLEGLFGAILASMIYFVFVGLASAIHGLRKEQGSTKWLLGVCGILNVFVFGFLGYEFVMYPDVWALTPLTYGFIALSIVSGAVIYFASKWYNAKRGIDISLAYKELPPE